MALISIQFDEKIPLFSSTSWSDLNEKRPKYKKPRNASESCK